MSLRVAVAVGCGIVIGATVTAYTSGLWRPAPVAPVPARVVDRPVAEAKPQVPTTGRSATPPPEPYPASSSPAVAHDRPPAPLLSGRIFRCRVNGTTMYSSESCPNGQIVDGTSAVDGFDSRPSAKLERLVVNGREPTVEATPPGRVASVAPLRNSEPVQCASMRRQIVDLDNQARYLNSARALDELRATRQDIRTSMARLHC